MKFWEYIGEIVWKSLEKNWWSFVENLLASWEKFGEVLEKNWWSEKSWWNLEENVVKYWERFGEILENNG